VLAEHVEQSVLIALREGFVVPPTPGKEIAALYAAFIAHGVAGAVEVWLQQPAPRDEHMLLAAAEAMYPAWYAPDPGPRTPAPQVTKSIAGETS
jgi:hypothetical protein